MLKKFNETSFFDIIHSYEEVIMKQQNIYDNDEFFEQYNYD